MIALSQQRSRKRTIISLYPFSLYPFRMALLPQVVVTHGRSLDLDAPVRRSHEDLIKCLYVRDILREPRIRETTDTATAAQLVSSTVCGAT